MPIHPYQGKWPTLGARVFLAPGAHLVGDVTLGDDVSFWFHTVARGDVHWIRVGARTNIQDGAVLHVAHLHHPLVIGEGVVVGHQAVIHGCTIEDGALIGIGARVLDGAVIERGAQVGAGAVVAPGHRIPAGHLAEEESLRIADTAERYAALKEQYRQTLGQTLGSGTERQGTTETIREETKP
jgi:carbonic anhydrase/acetyltransferase-like protein (isoleucine patch superfamily)